MRKLLNFFVLLLLVVAKEGYSATPPGFFQNPQASWVLNGLVVDELNNPVASATVQLVGRGSSTKTDVNGKFLIEVTSEADSLAVSFVGYFTNRVRIGNVKTITIKLDPDVKGQKLDEVQVVGYGTQKKTTMVGAVSTASVKDIRKYSTPSLSNALSGRLAGVVTRQTSGEPGYDAAKIFIRGLVSQSGSNKPLVVIDGVERDLQDYWTTINVQEIESISVLKDATATAVYGSRGANGVLLITTKRGVVGKPKVNFRTEAASSTPLRVEKVIDGYEFALLVNESRSNKGELPKYTPAEIQKFKDGSDPYAYPSVNWYDVVFRDHTSQAMANLGIQGGSENVQYYVNLGYTLQQGLYNDDPNGAYKTNAALKRYSFRSNTDFKLSKTFSLNLGVSSIISTTNFPGTGKDRIFDVLKLTSPVESPVKNPDGSAPGGTGDSKINPYTVITATGYTRQFYTTLINNLGAKWDLSAVTPGLSMRGLFAYDVVDITQDIREQSPGTYKYNPVTKTYTTINTQGDLGYRTANENYKKIYGEAAVEYKRNFGKHGVSGMLLAQRREFVNVNAGSSIDNLPSRQQGLVGRLNYYYDSRYLLELNAGYTGSEQFPKGSQYGLFPSIGAGWLVSNEKFWNTNFINVLKLRGSYGLVGNDQIGGDRFLFLTLFEKNAAGYGFGTNQDQNIGGKSEKRLGNLNLTWETSYKADLGMDMEMLNGKITLTADVFHERREGQLLRRQIIPIYTGLASFAPFANVGITENKGIEGSFQFRNTTKNGFYYSFNGNIVYAKNKIIENDVPPKQYPWQELRGYPIGSNLGYEAIGFFQDQADIAKSPVQTFGPVGPGDVKYRDINGDNKIDNADLTVIGKYGSEPQIVFGFGANFAYKGFDASIFLNGNANRDFFFSQRNWTAWAFSQDERYNVLQEYYDHRWIPGQDNSKAKFPAIRASSQNNYQGSTIWQRNGSYLRIRTAEIGYSLPTKTAKKVLVNNARVFIQGTNLATWDKIKVLDPESNFGTGDYPIPRTINFGLEVSF